jgi:hypothetical protein
MGSSPAQRWRLQGLRSLGVGNNGSVCRGSGMGSGHYPVVVIEPLRPCACDPVGAVFVSVCLPSVKMVAHV